MRFYKITCENTERVRYRTTLDIAKDTVRGSYASTMFGYVRIELVEIEVNQGSVASILSGDGAEEKVLRTWAITDRGGVKEVPNGE